MRSFSHPAAIAALAVLVAGGPAAAQTAHAPQTESQGSTALEGVTVAVSKTPPTVVKTVPAAGAVVDPGVTILTVTFDQHMDPNGWRYAKGEGGDYPQCLEKPRLLADQETFVLLCTTSSSKTYSVRLNEPEQPGFTGVGHRPATPFELSFSTSKGHPVSSLPQALTVAGLHDDDSPIEGTETAKP